MQQLGLNIIMVYDSCEWQLNWRSQKNACASLAHALSMTMVMWWCNAVRIAQWSSSSASSRWSQWMPPFDKHLHCIVPEPETAMVIEKHQLKTQSTAKVVKIAYLKIDPLHSSLKQQTEKNLRHQYWRRKAPAKCLMSYASWEGRYLPT